MSKRGILRILNDGRVAFWCPGCDGAHAVTINDGSTTSPHWGFNGDYDRPTFTPSILVTYNGADADTGDGIPSVCHSFVNDGQIQFLTDCTHALAGQTVALKDFDA